jgi:hypothetical protein
MAQSSFFHFLNILNSLEKYDIYINAYKFCLIAIVTSCLYYGLHALSVNIALIFDWNCPQKYEFETYCNVALKELQKHKVQCEILA